VRNLVKSVELCGQYYEDGADEVLRFASENVFVPLTMGGGIRDFNDANGSYKFRHYTNLEVASDYFRSGADKISIGSDVVYATEKYLRTEVKSGTSSLEQIFKVYGNQVNLPINVLPVPFSGHGVPDDLPKTVIRTFTQRSGGSGVPRQQGLCRKAGYVRIAGCSCYMRVMLSQERSGRGEGVLSRCTYRSKHDLSARCYNHYVGATVGSTSP
ncbi:Imidazole glycerol phosphate synthase hisHF chloroplastic, partial [Bienertia sinuspersici]